MSTSDTKRAIIAYLSYAGFLLLFGIIYEYFSHGVFSPFMVFSCVVPILGCVICWLFSKALIKRKIKSSVSLELLGGAVIWLSLGSVAKGVLDIFGSTNVLNWGFLIVGVALLLAAFIAQILLLRSKNNTKNKHKKAHKKAQ